MSPAISKIDQRIIPLVTCMNKKGMETYASCQGHGFPLDKLKPYVAFRTDLITAKKLARLLREDAESEQHRLNWGWEVEARFDSCFVLIFHLFPTNPHRRYFRYLRQTLNEDLDQLPLLLEEIICDSAQDFKGFDNT
ncbi:hypothetical protein [Klebsiella quasipneumoniae]|uniref:hypothetical protein n=1 Tax=Klebsiella quasipneumoniae TaxID=1463165 RepID=UPI00160710E9|nr:hypothetical protein [Klebsiella quasipneumoniae]